jgi:hypothetical protein
MFSDETVITIEGRYWTVRGEIGVGVRAGLALVTALAWDIYVFPLVHRIKYLKSWFNYYTCTLYYMCVLRHFVIETLLDSDFITINWEPSLYACTKQQIFVKKVLHENIELCLTSTTKANARRCPHHQRSCNSNTVVWAWFAQRRDATTFSTYTVLASAGIILSGKLRSSTIEFAHF